MILFSVAGFLGTHYLGSRVLLPAGVLVGMIVANFVPAKSCSTK